MDMTAALTADEVAALADAERTWQHAWEQMRGSRPLSLHGASGEDVGRRFEESLRFKNTVDGFEELAAESPSWDRLSILLNCEYQLFRLNEDTPLRHNPFLSHWVEAIQRLQPKLLNPRPSRHPDSAALPDSHGIVTTRLRMIQTLLKSEEGSQILVNLTPKLLYDIFADAHHPEEDEFDIRPYVHVLEEEGIYEPAAHPPDASAPNTLEISGPTSPSQPAGKKTPAADPTQTQDWKQVLLEKLQNQPDVAMSELAHLPIELPCLEFLTTLIETSSLEKLSIDPAHVVCNYLQHALRLTEQMGPQQQQQQQQQSASPFPSSSTPPPPGLSSPFSNTSNQNSPGPEMGSNGAGVDYSRAAQVRAVKLLLLFVRNLIRKALLPPEAIYFEIQEICVRYVWIKEVREFRAFIEEGAGADGERGVSSELIR